jgi:hypothetical protein
MQNGKESRTLQQCLQSASAGPPDSDSMHTHLYVGKISRTCRVSEVSVVHISIECVKLQINGRPILRHSHSLTLTPKLLSSQNEWANIAVHAGKRAIQVEKSSHKLAAKEHKDARNRIAFVPRAEDGE